MELEWIQFSVLVLTAIILFLYGLESFSREVFGLGETHFKTALARITNHRLVAFGIGASLTALIQSSSAVSVLAIALVNSGVLPFGNSLAVLLGTNLGTTVTAHLVALKMTQLGPFFIVLGFVLSLLKIRWSIFGKVVFYFGFILFSLDLISKTLLPLRETQEIMELLSGVIHPLYAIAAGALVTILVQSSSVTTGLAILLVQQGQIPVSVAIPLMLGANVGTTITGLLACLRMDVPARRAAVSNFMFNLVGVGVIYPFVGVFGEFVTTMTNSPEMAVATGHLLFNAGVSIVFLVALKPFAGFVERVVPQKSEAKLEVSVQ
jgi:phosphate:Na+ symporter